MKFIIIFSVIITVVRDVSPAKILAVCPTQMRSHYIVVEQLLRDLAESGHNVTVISQFTVKNPPKNYREIVIDLSNESYYGKEYFYNNRNCYRNKPKPSRGYRQSLKGCHQSLKECCQFLRGCHQSSSDTLLVNGDILSRFGDTLLMIGDTRLVTGDIP